jgi:hypothetical protein
MPFCRDLSYNKIAGEGIEDTVFKELRNLKTL